MERAVLEMLGRHPDLALVVSDAEGRLTTSTPALHRILGGHSLPDAVTGLGSLPLFDSSDTSRLMPADLPIARALRGEVVIDQVVTLRRCDGQTLHLRCNAGPLRDEGDAVRGAITLVQDATADWVGRLMHDKLRDRLVTTVNHELRTPLTKIIGHSELLVDAAAEGTLPDSVTRSVAAVARASQELAALARRLTHLGELDAMSRVDLDRAELVELVGSAVNGQRRTAHRRGVHLEVAGSQLPLRATVDARLVHRAIGELLGNSLRFAPPGSTVTTGVRRFDGHVEIFVADQGPGIPVADRSRLLHPFERGQLDGGSTSSPGLGLAVVAAVAAAHGGQVILEDNQPGGLVARLCLRSS